MGGSAAGTGHLRVAIWDGAAVDRYDPEGELDTTIALPTSRPTSCWFGGSDRSRLFITTATYGLRTPRRRAGECAQPRHRLPTPNPTVLLPAQPIRSSLARAWATVRLSDVAAAFRRASSGRYASPYTAPSRRGASIR